MFLIGALCLLFSIGKMLFGLGLDFIDGASAVVGIANLVLPFVLPSAPEENS